VITDSYERALQGRGKLGLDNGCLREDVGQIRQSNKGRVPNGKGSRAQCFNFSILGVVVRRNGQLLSYLYVIRITQFIAVGVEDTHEFACIAIELSTDL
jgi:hypothetical protein